MGMRIDRLAISVLICCATYLFFLNATGSIPLAAISAFAAIVLLKKVTQKLPSDAIGKKRRLLADARTELEELALINPDAAAQRIREVLFNAYPSIHENTAVIPVIRHPGGRKFTSDELISIWQSANGHSRVIIAVTVPCDEPAVSLSARLSSPAVNLIDAPALIRLIAESGPSPAHILKSPPRSSLFAAISRATGRAKTGKCFLTGIIMLALFFITGVPAYITGAVLLFFISGVSLRKRRLQHDLL